MIKICGLKYLLSLWGVLLIVINSTNAQNGPSSPGKINIASPTAAALGKYGDFPVGYNTGTPQISIPLYTITEGPISVPVSLSYHAGGLKVMESSSWVGAGFSLNAGGVITRSVIGGVDEVGTGSLTNQTHGYFKDYGYNNYLFENGNPGTGPPLTNDGKIAQDFEFSSGRRDGEPDLFFFNFGSYSGKFYFNDDRTPIIVPEQDFKIQVINPSDNLITGFIVTTADGTKYYFGNNQTPSNGGVNAVEITNSYDPQSSGGIQYSSAYSAWYVTKISSADNQFSVILKYDEEKYSNYTLSTFPLKYNDVYGEKEFHLIKNYIKGVRLNSITSTNNTITLNAGNLREDLSNFNQAYNTATDEPNTEAKSLSSIQISNSGSLCKKFKFTYSYFTDNTTSLPAGLNATSYNITSDKKRLKLDKIQEFSCDELTSVPPHVFDYFTEKVPRKLTFAQDHWGFYNGADNNTRLIPTYTVNDFDVQTWADRDSKWPEMRGGTVQKITYPTGGNTVFEFEPHTTWLSYTDKIPTYRFTTQVGYDGSTQNIYNDKYFSANGYEIRLSNTACQWPVTSCAASALVQNSTGYAYAEGGQTVKTYFTTTPGIHQIIMSKNNPVTGYGAEATFTELVPTLVEKNEIVGGLRIKKITSADAINVANSIVKNYTYTDATGNSSGILYSKPTYVQVIRNDVLRDIGIGTLDNGNNAYLPNGCVSPENASIPPAPILFYQVSPSSIRPMETVQGNHIGYNEVKVSQTGNGSSVYRYYGSDIWDMDHTDVCIRKAKVSPPSIPTIPSSPAAPLSFEYKRGELKYEGNFNENGQLLKEVWHTPTYADNPVVTPGIKYGNGNNMNFFTMYSLATKRKTQDVTTENIVTPGLGQVQNVTTTFYESPYHVLPTRTTTLNSKGETNESKQKYAFDFELPACAAISTCLQAYQNSVASANATFNSQLPCTSGSFNCKWILYQQLRRDINLARIAYTNCRRQNFTDPVNAYKTAHDNGKAAAGTELKPILELQDMNFNAPIETSVWKSNNLLSASFNRYDYVANPTGFTYLNKAQAINVSSLSSSFTPAAINGNSITKDSRYQDEIVLQYNNGNTVESKGKDGIYTSYIWAYNNTLPVVKATGVNYVTLKAAYDAVGGDLTQIRNQSSLSSALINTYFYTPGVGMIKETDPRGRNINYEYDALNRLVLIRDHDNNIIKKICYNYAGQAENCITCTNFTPNWQNTTTALRCQQGSCGNTGYQEQEQMDMNICSPTYNQTQWVTAGYNSTACPLGDCVNLTSTNVTAATGYTASYLNTATNITYNFAVPAATGLQSLGTVSAGNYTLIITRTTGTPMYGTFKSGCWKQTITGSSAIFYNVAVSTTTCNSITVDISAEQ